MVSGELVELDSEALRFRSWEVEELFRLVYGEPLSPEAAAALTRRTAGWAAGLMLFHLSTTGKSSVERERAVADLGGRSRLLRSYLTRNVLDELDPERREFLLATCTLGTLTGPLCDALLEREGSAVVLEELASRQFFTTLDDNGRAYRYHQVLQTLLEGLLVDELGHRAAVDLYGRSALLLESEGLPREALRAYAMAEDFASVARVLQQSSSGLAMDPQLAQLDDAGDDPWLALVRARRLQRAGAFAAAVAAFREAEGLLDDSEFRRRCGEERAVAGVWLADATLPDQPVPGATRSRAAAQSVRAATRRLPAPDRLPPQPLAEGVVLLLAGEVGRAARKLAHVAPGSTAEQLYADLARVVAEIVDGAGGESVATLEQIILTAEVEEQPWLARLARGVQASVLLVTSGEPWRVESCESLVEECERSGDAWGDLLLAGALGVAHTLRRDPAAGRWLDRSARGAGSLNAPVLAAWTEYLGAFVARQHGDAGRSGASRPRTDPRPGGRPGRCGRDAGASPRSRRGYDVDGPGCRDPVSRCVRDRGGRHGAHPASSPPAATDAPPPAGTQPGAGRPPRGAHRPAVAGHAAGRGGAPAARGGLQRPAMPRRRRAGRRRGAPPRECVQPGRGGRDPRRGGVRDRAPGGVPVRGQGDQRGALAAEMTALEAYQGDLLDEAGPAEWVVGERDRLRIAAATAAYSAGRLSLRLRTPAEALPLARRATELDPLRDSAWAMLAEVQERMGDLGSAAATRREHALVASELSGP